MARSSTRAALQGGNFMGMMNILMQLRKVGGAWRKSCLVCRRRRNVPMQSFLDVQMHVGAPASST